jgi:hypothetical protein
MPTRRRPKPSDNSSYDVGYAKPPEHTRFRPGQSGNPAGRRKGVANLKSDVVRTLAAPLKVKEDGRTRTRSTQQGALMLLRDKALRGDARALDRMLELAVRFNNDSADSGPSQPLSSDDQAILAAYVAEITGPPVVPQLKNRKDKEEPSDE